MPIEPSDIDLVQPEFHAFDMFSKDGGYHTSQIVPLSDVDGLFLPGAIVGSDASEAYRDQYRKTFIKNLSEQPLYNCKVYGYNTKRNSIVKFAFEKQQNQTPLIDGSETIKDYPTQPNLFTAYSFTETDSDDAIPIGNGGILSEGKAQGIWLRMRCLKNISDDGLDTFRLGLKYTETNG